MDDRTRVIALNLVPELGTIRLRRLLDAFGTLAGVAAAPEEHLRGVEGMTPELADRLASVFRSPKMAVDELGLAARHGCRVVTRLDEAYPEPLASISDPPWVLYMKGEWTPADRAAVAIVGSRRSSIYGQQVAERLGYELALRGISVLSGLARGIDAAAHRGALRAGGRTLAVVGNGLASVYPPEHRELTEQVAAHGAVISEYPMDTQPLPFLFPRRNRLISGLSLGVVVVEAAQRSGALITADCALEQGREVFAVPGKVDSLTSSGTNQLLKQGARLVTGVDDILEELGLDEPAPSTPARGTSRPAAAAGDISSADRGMLEALHRDQPTDVEVLAQRIGRPPAQCASTLLRLQLKRLVKQLPGNRFVRI